MVRVWRTIAKVFLIIIVSSLLLLLFFSVSTILTTFIVYALLAKAGWHFITCLETRYSKALPNIKIAFLSTLITMFCVELSLRYIVKRNLSYNEINGSAFYFSPYLDNKVKDLVGIISDSNKDRWPIERNKPNSAERQSNTVEYNYVNDFNSLGLRGPEPYHGKAFQILSLGDSFTEGACTPEDSTWVHLLAERLDHVLPDTVCYLNGGKSGGDPFLSFYTMKEMMKIYHPDLVVLLINGTDIGDHILRMGKERFADHKRIHYPWGAWWEPLYACSYIFRGCAHLFSNRDYLFHTPEEHKRKAIVANNAILDLFIHDYKPLLDSAGIDFWIFNIPLESEIDNDIKNYAGYSKVLSQENIHYVDLFDDILPASQKRNLPLSDIYWKKDMHFNSQGYDILADLMYNYIVKDSMISIKEQLKGSSLSKN